MPETEPVESIARFFRTQYEIPLIDEAAVIRERVRLRGIYRNSRTVENAGALVRQYLRSLDDQGGIVLADQYAISRQKVRIRNTVFAATGYSCDPLLPLSLSEPDSDMNAEYAVERMGTPFWKLLQERNHKLWNVSRSNCQYWADAGDLSFGPLASRVLELLMASLPMCSAKLLDTLWRNVMATLSMCVASGLYPTHVRHAYALADMVSELRHGIPIGTLPDCGTRVLTYAAK